MEKEVYFLSHGNLLDGGYRHEQFFAKSLAKKYNCNCVEIRKNGLFSGSGLFKLFLWGMSNTNGDINVVSSRLGLGAYLSNFWKREVENYIVFHNYNFKRHNSTLIRFYYFILFTAIKLFKPKRTKIVVISTYWVEYFNKEKGIPLNNIKLFPNFINVTKLIERRSNSREKTIHLGQFSAKNSNLIYDLARELKKIGYNSYFSTLDRNAELETDNYSIVYFETYYAYIVKMAKAEYTIAFSEYNEGWNRVVHESALLNTPVIGFKIGGMQDLISESLNSFVSKEEAIKETLAIIKEAKDYKCPNAFLSKYDEPNAVNYL